MAKANKNRPARTGQKASPSMAVAPPEAPTGEANPNQAGAPDAAKSAKKERKVDPNRKSLHVTVLNALQDKIDERVKERDVPQAGIVREALYQYFGEAMPADELTAGAKRTYRSPEEREAAKKQKSEELQQLLELSKLARAQGKSLTDLLSEVKSRITAEVPAAA